MLVKLIVHISMRFHWSFEDWVRLDGQNRRDAEAVNDIMMFIEFHPGNTIIIWSYVSCYSMPSQPFTHSTTQCSYYKEQFTLKWFRFIKRKTKIIRIPITVKCTCTWTVSIYSFFVCGISYFVIIILMRKRRYTSSYRSIAFKANNPRILFVYC